VANDYQIGGSHYRLHNDRQQHWDYAWSRKFDFFQYQITKYVERWRDKGGLDDLRKARHFLDKYIECIEADMTPELDAEIHDKMVGKSSIKPTGWEGFVYEGGTRNQDIYKCNKCLVTFWVKPGESPHTHDPHCGEPGKAYTSQD